MTVKEVVQTFSFDELTPEAQERALEVHREALRNDTWFYGTLDNTITPVAEFLGIDLENINWQRFYRNEGEGACFIGTYKYLPNATENIKKLFPNDALIIKLAEDLQVLQSAHAYNLEASVEYAGCICHKDFAVIKSNPNNNRLDELLRDFMGWIYTKLKNDFELLSSMEVCEDIFNNNNYLFSLDGTPLCEEEYA
ncbi:hypothetical protein [Dehalococcoides sp. THU4]|uniref:hypothetical protein n=1 Tax=Dehalococcoides sp. THU4 TaxID=3348344 RepID=UPI00371D086B